MILDQDINLHLSDKYVRFIYIFPLRISERAQFKSLLTFFSKKNALLTELLIKRAFIGDLKILILI